MSTDSQVIESSKVGSVVHSEHFALPVFDFMFEDVPGLYFEHLNLLIQRGFDDGRDAIGLTSLALGTP